MPHRPPNVSSHIFKVVLCSVCLLGTPVVAIAMTSILNHSVSYQEDTGELIFTAETQGDFVRRQFFLDNDNNTETGLDGGFDYLMENGRWWAYAGTDGEWAWTRQSTEVGGNSGDDAFEDAALWQVEFEGTLTVDMPYQFRVAVNDDETLEVSGVTTGVTLPSETVVDNGNAGPGLEILEADARLDSLTNTITIDFATTGEFDRRLVLIDSDNDSGTGFDDGFDYLLENGSLFEYIGTGGPDWAWNPSGTVSGSIADLASEDEAQWQFPIEPLASNVPLRFVAEEDDSGTQLRMDGLLDQESSATAIGPFTLADDNSNFPNPHRGTYLYSKFNVDGNEAWSGVENGMEAQRQLGRSLALLLVDLDTHITSERLPDSLLQSLDATLNEIAEGGFKAVLRGRYKLDNTECSADLNSEPSLEVIGTHIGQLADIINNNPAAIAYIEAGMVGAWGEWNCSRHLIETGDIDVQVASFAAVADSVINAWQNATPGVYINVRRPWIKAAAQLVDAERVGHHNDCFLSSTEHAGTYTDGLAGREFLQGNDSSDGDTSIVPIGGENCGIADSYIAGVEDADIYAPDQNDLADVCSKGIQALEDYRYTYLHNRLRLDQPLESAENTASWWPFQWHQGGCWDEVQSRLGYRFDLENIELRGDASPGGEMELAIAVNNLGFARLYKDAMTELLFIDAAGALTRSLALTNLQPTGWQPAATTLQSASFQVPSDLPAGDYSLALRLSDPDAPDNNLQTIRFANAGWDTETGAQIFASTTDGSPLTVTTDNNSVMTAINDDTDISLFEQVALDDSALNIGDNDDVMTEATSDEESLDTDAVGSSGGFEGGSGGGAAILLLPVLAVLRRQRHAAAKTTQLLIAN